jgi:hypothetical protein
MNTLGIMRERAERLRVNKFIKKPRVTGPTAATEN